jgi:excisionase family DNA binding protein
MANKQWFTIHEAAQILGVHKDTIKYWEQNNLIPKAKRNPKNGYRVYDVQAIKEIARSRGIYELEIDAVIVQKTYFSS